MGEIIYQSSTFRKVAPGIAHYEGMIVYKYKFHLVGSRPKGCYGTHPSFGTSRCGTKDVPLTDQVDYVDCKKCRNLWKKESL